MQQWILAAGALGALLPFVVAGGEVSGPPVRAVTLAPAGGAPAAGHPVQEPSLAALARESDRIFIGTARRVRYQTERRSGLVYTHVTFDELTILKGGRPGARGEIGVRVAGGRDQDGTLVRVAGIPRFEPGGRYLLFRKAGPSRFCPLTGWARGCYRLVPAKRGRAGSAARGSLAGWVVLDADGGPILAVRAGQIIRRRSHPGHAPPREPQSLFGAAVPRAGHPPQAGARLTRISTAPSAALPGGIEDAPGSASGHRRPTITRVTGGPGLRRSASPHRLSDAMSAAAFVAAIRQAITR